MLLLLEHQKPSLILAVPGQPALLADFVLIHVVPKSSPPVSKGLHLSCLEHWTCSGFLYSAAAEKGR